MAFYHIGTEDIHFVRGGGATVRLDVPHGTVSYRPDWARCSLFATSGTFWRAPLDAHPVSTAEFWLSFRIMQAATALSTPHFLRLLDGTAYGRLLLVGRQGQYPKLYRHNNDDSLTLLATGTLPMFTTFAVGLVNVYVNLGTGKFQLYLERALSIDFTGDLTGGEYAAINYVDLSGGDFQGAAYFSEFVWSDEDTRKIVGVKTIYPYDDGFAQDWSGFKEDVNEVEVNENTANWTDTAGLLQEYTVLGLPSDLAASVVVSAVMLGARLATNPVDTALVVRTGGADYLSVSYDTGGAVEDRMNIWTTNPDTGLPWSKDDLNDAAFNIGVASS